MIKRIFEGPTINTVSVGFDMELFDRGLIIAYAYGKPHIVCSIKSKDLLISEVIKDCSEQIETTYKGKSIEINNTLPYGEFLVTIPDGKVVVKYKVLI